MLTACGKFCGLGRGNQGSSGTIPPSPLTDRPTLRPSHILIVPFSNACNFKRGPAMEIAEWHHPHDQMCVLGRHSWSVPRLFELARNLPVMEIPLNHLNVYYSYEKLTLRNMVMHIKAVNAADLDKPIILDEDGELMDGRHRVMKAMLTGAGTIKAVRFEENPSPCRVSEGTGE